MQLDGVGSDAALAMLGVEEPGAGDGGRDVRGLELVGDRELRVRLYQSSHCHAARATVGHCLDYSSQLGRDPPQI